MDNKYNENLGASSDDRDEAEDLFLRVVDVYKRQVYNPASDTRPAVCIIPAIVYDKEGFRIGYGKGFYDRYLPSFSGTKIGLAYNDFIIDKVPRGKYDLSADVLITEKGITAINTK